MERIDFKAIEQNLRIELVAKSLNLTLEPHNGQYRAHCPTCNRERSIVLTPNKNMWCCFAAPKNGDRFLGGSIVGLVAHVKQIDLREAAKFLMEPEAQPETKKNPFEGLDGVKDKLDHAHEKVKALGFPELVARALGIGYCSKGLMQGKVCIPIRNEHGLLTGYIGITEAKLPSKWRLS